MFKVVDIFIVFIYVMIVVVVVLGFEYLGLMNIVFVWMMGVIVFIVVGMVYSVVVWVVECKVMEDEIYELKVVNLVFVEEFQVVQLCLDEIMDDL